MTDNTHSEINRDCLEVTNWESVIEPVEEEE